MVVVWGAAAVLAGVGGGGGVCGGRRGEAVCRGCWVGVCVGGGRQVLVRCMLVGMWVVARPATASVARLMTSAKVGW